MKKRQTGYSIFALCVFSFLLVCFFAGCGSTPAPLIPDDIPALAGRGKPTWIDNYPSNPDFYVGVGSSKSGDQGTDLEIAKAKALVALASSISTEIKSELSITARDDSAGNSFQSAEQVIKESVEANLSEVEIVDSYYSQEDGYWFYLRLNKSVWESIQREESDRLAGRVVGIVEPLLGNSAVPVFSRLGALGKGWLLLAESPYASIIEAQLYDEYGVLLDLIERRMVEYIDSFSVAIDPVLIEVSPQNPVPVFIAVKSATRLQTGKIQLKLSFPDTGYESIDITTDEEGVFSGNIIVPIDEPGNTRMRVSIGFDQIPDRFGFPEAEAMLKVTPVTAFLEVTVPAEIDGRAVQGSLESLISSNLPVELTGLQDADFTISVEITARSAPPNQFGLVIVYLRAFVSIGSNGNITASFESTEVKEGGLDFDQAYARSFAKLVEQLEGSPDLFKGLEKAFSAETK